MQLSGILLFHFLSRLSPISATQLCNSLNGGDLAISQTTVVMIPNAGWYQGSAGDNITVSTTFVWNNPGGVSLVASIIDCFCAGDPLSGILETPSLSQFFFAFPVPVPSDTANCIPYNNDPTVCLARDDIYAQGVRIFGEFTDPGLYKVITTNSLRSCIANSNPPNINQIGYFIRLDEAVYTGPVCAFNNSVVTLTQTTSIPPQSRQVRSKSAHKINQPSL